MWSRALLLFQIVAVFFRIFPTVLLYSELVWRAVLPLDFAPNSRRVMAIFISGFLGSLLDV